MQFLEEKNIYAPRKEGFVIDVNSGKIDTIENQTIAKAKVNMIYIYIYFGYS
jgi:hypothetical protein